jgi:hypothetical protein
MNKAVKRFVVIAVVALVAVAVYKFASDRISALPKLF